MNNSNTKILLATSIALLLSSNVNAAASAAKTTTDSANAAVTNEVNVSFDHPQTIAVAEPTNVTGAATDTGTSRTTWVITSNNAVDVSFTGTSKSDTGTEFAAPRFHKQDVDANGDAIDNNYDHLTTLFGAIVSGHQSRSGTADAWKGGATPAGIPTTLVASTGNPGEKFGRVMPSDAGVFNLDLYATGRGDTSTTQSGVYSTTLTAVITADEQE
jgi:hypothetical protein